MTDQPDVFIANKYAQSRTVKGLTPAENTPGFRVFRISPDAIEVQVRTNSDKQVRIAGLGLNRDDARKVAARLLKFANGEG